MQRKFETFRFASLYCRVLWEKTSSRQKCVCIREHNNTATEYHDISTYCKNVSDGAAQKHNESISRGRETPTREHDGNTLRERGILHNFSSSDETAELYRLE